MIKVTTSVAQDFAAVLRKVKQGKRFLLKNHDKGVAAIVSVEDLALLEAIENRHDLEAARQALLRSPRKGLSLGGSQEGTGLGMTGRRSSSLGTV